MRDDVSVIRPDDFAEKNKIYDTAAGALWHLAVYEPVHGGLEFTNMAGAALLDFIGATYVGEDDQVLDLCSGTGETCRYLATRYRCSVTGIELNSALLRHAVGKQRNLPLDVQRRIRFRQADVTTWESDRPYDLVLSVDSLTLLAEPRRALLMAFEALAPGGHLILADIVSGPELTEPVRTQVWEYDGIRPLPPAEATGAILTGIGFQNLARADMSDTAVDCFLKIFDALQEKSREIESVCGADEYQLWCESTQFYLRSFSSGELNYWRYTAQHP